MKVHELIEKLKSISNQNAEVRIDSTLSNLGTINGIYWSDTYELQNKQGVTISSNSKSIGQKYTIEEL